MSELNIRKTKRLTAFLLFILWGSAVLNLYENISHTHNMPSPLKYIMSLTSSLDNDVDDDYDDNDRGLMSNGSTCSPRNNVYFLKTHKCASSTLQNIFMRYGLKYNLSFVLPRSRYRNNAGFPNFFHSKFILPNDEKKFNIFCHHSRFRYDTIREVMPKGTVFMSIVRNPIDLFESAVRYFSGTKLSLANYIAYMKKKPRARAFYSQNPMLFDLGVPTVDDKVELEQGIRDRIKQFDLILMSDYFEESVILMKDFLCWSMEDVVYVIHNQRKNSTRNGLSVSDTKVVQEWNYGDELLYSIVNQTFWQRMQQFGETRMQSEINRLRRVRRRWESRCIENQTTNEHIQDPRMKVWHPNALGFLLKSERQADESCVYLVTPELKFTRDLYLRQLRLYP